MVEAGQSYKFLDTKGNEQAYAILEYDAASGTHRVMDLVRRKNARKHLGGLTIVKSIRKCSVRPNTTKLTPSTTQLYVVQTGSGTYKIGCTDDLDARMRAGKTWCAKLRLVATRTIPAQKSSEWRRYESKLHKRLAKKRCVDGGNEVFALKMAEVNVLKRYMKNMRFD